MKNLTTGNIYKTFILFAIPLVLSGLLSQSYSIIDTIIAGKFLGPDGLAAIGATSSYITLISAIFWGYISGFAVYIATLFGAGEYDKIKTSICSNLIFIIISIFSVSLISVIFHEPIFDFLKVDATIRHDTFIYFTIYLLGIFMILSNTFGVFVMNAFGASSFPFLMSIVSTILNISGNIFTITVLNWGVAGVAISSLFAALIVDTCYFFKINNCFKQLGCKKTKQKFNIESIKKSLPYAGPVTLQQTAMYFSSLAISPLVNGIGSAATAAYTVVLRIYNLNAEIYQNSTKTVSNYSAQCVGAKKYHLLNKGLVVGLIQGILFLSPVLIISVLFPEKICSAFFPKGYSGEGLDFSVLYVRFYLPFILFNVINNLFHSFFRSIKSMNILLSATVIGSVTRIIFSIILVKYYGISGVYLGWIISWIIEAIYNVAIFFAGKWREKFEKEM